MKKKIPYHVNCWLITVIICIEIWWHFKLFHQQSSMMMPPPGMPPGMPPPNFNMPPPGFPPPESGRPTSADSPGPTAPPTQNAANDSSAELWVETRTPEGKVLIANNCFFVWFLQYSSRNTMIVTLNLLWSEFANTNERRFDLLLQILITYWLSVTNSLQSKF